MRRGVAGALALLAAVLLALGRCGNADAPTATPSSGLLPSEAPPAVVATPAADSPSPTATAEPPEPAPAPPLVEVTSPPPTALPSQPPIPTSIATLEPTAIPPPEVLPPPPAPAPPPPTPTATSAPTVTPVVRSTVIRNNAFEFEIVVPPGSAVTWTNTDVAVHTVTSTQGAFDSGFLVQGQSFSRVFPTEGTFPYVCRVHPSMQATVIVR